MRQEIEVPGISHGSVPIPMGTRIGNLVFSSAISGWDPNTGKVVEDPGQQVHQLFENIKAFMKAAGGTPADVGRMTVYIANDEARPLINEEWLAMYPNSQDRPARHAVLVPLRAGVVAQIEITAVLQ